MKKHNSKSIISILTMILITFVLISCGKNYEADNTADYNSKTESKVEMVEADNESIAFDNTEYGENNSTDNKKLANKIIVNEIIDMETLKFEEDKNSILNRIDVYNGYIESSNITGRSINDTNSRRRANLVARIPKDKLKNFKTDIKKFGNIINTNINSQDITMKYFDTQSHVKSLEIQEERLLDLLKKSGQLKDILEVEKELQRVRYEIERLTGNLKKWDNLVEYATITINIFEVKEYQEVVEDPETWGEKIVSAFNKSIKGLVDIFKGFVIILVAVLPFAVVVGIITIPAYSISKKIKNKYKK